LGASPRRRRYWYPAGTSEFDGRPARLLRPPVDLFIRLVVPFGTRQEVLDEGWLPSGCQQPVILRRRNDDCRALAATGHRLRPFVNGLVHHLGKMVLRVLEMPV